MPLILDPRVPVKPLKKGKHLNFNALPGCPVLKLRVNKGRVGDADPCVAVELRKHQRLTRLLMAEIVPLLVWTEGIPA